MSKLRLTNVEGGIADLAAFGDYAYLNFIDEGGNNFWGTFPHRLGPSQGAPLLLFSDRDLGLYILRYDG